jgi:hypothetical protein
MFSVIVGVADMHHAHPLRLLYAIKLQLDVKNFNQAKNLLSLLVSKR